MATTLSAALVIAILVSLLKPLLELACPPGAALHDAAIRGLAVLLGVAGALLQAAAGPHALTLATAQDAAGAGLLNAITAIAGFHLVSGSYFTADPAPAQPPAAPVPVAPAFAPIAGDPLAPVPAHPELQAPR